MGCHSGDGISDSRLSERNEKLNQHSSSDKFRKWQCGRCHDMGAKSSPSRIMAFLFKSLGRLPAKIPQLSTPFTQGHAFVLRAFCWMIDYCLGYGGLCLSSQPRGHPSYKTQDSAGCWWPFFARSCLVPFSMTNSTGNISKKKTSTQASAWETMSWDIPSAQEEL